ncbi:HsdM family class I SAM-dependent methyltransferase [Azonexus hydrophilus]|uniref:HsdM family class I SAM-dependent methyltransferase n=1 Tax=Azonexus hydrophilus TaxID=418702 RepID=UPI0004097233|nr:N-6 DNA methylase [Azonexus hydrophilus]
MRTTLDRLGDFGARPVDCVELHRQDDPRLLRYVDLIRGGSSPMVDTVIENKAQALLYVVDVARLSGLADSARYIAELRRKLAMRGDPAWLGVLRLGRLDIYATDLRPVPDSKPVSFFADQADALGVLARLAYGENLAQPSELLLRSVLFGLMTDASQELKEMGMSTSESIALTGRALFFRYLIGRGIIKQHHLSAISPSAQSLEMCFASEDCLVETNAWLDQTFNGDLLKLPTQNYREYFRYLFLQLGQGLSRPLEAILGLDMPRAPGASQRSLNWGDLDFDHLPIGLLSETYEELMCRFDAETRHDTSVYYTPAHIAEYMVDEAFHRHPAGAAARVLDPACGAGVFLVASFRKLAELYFAETGRRPERAALRHILNEQLVGFDINAHARMLAALALYLTALELDPDPAPVEELTFSKLEGKVLIDVADPDADPCSIRPMAGSMGDHVSAQYRSAFDLVIGNPPWTSLKPAYAAIDRTFTKRCRAIAAQRGLLDLYRTYKNPDQVTDLPFIWGAMDWARPGGRIALALAGRWLFKMSPAGFSARSAIFRALSITGILNGASVRQTRVWPNVDQPFCLLFADNQVPQAGDQFVLVSPDDQPGLSEKGRMRIDASDAVPIALDLVTKQAALIKTLYRGSVLDAAIVQRIHERAKTSLGEYWNHEHGLLRGQGYQVAKRTDDDSFLEGYPTLGARYERHPFVVQTDTLTPYQPGGLQWPRSPEIYRAPLVLVREGYKSDRNQGRALLSLSNIAYSESYYGFSAANHPDGEFLAKYLLVLMHSQLFEYWALMTSAKFGVERESLQLRDIDSFPFVAPECFNASCREQIDRCAVALLDRQPDWAELDQTVAAIYGLGHYDRETIGDTLATRSPFPAIKQFASSPVSQHCAEQFRARLAEELSSVLAASGYQVHVQQLAGDSRLPWKFIAVCLGQCTLPEALPPTWIKHADDLAVSRITVVDAHQPLIVIGLLDQRRYWTHTQTRLLASDILWAHGALLEERAKR